MKALLFLPALVLLACITAAAQTPQPAQPEGAVPDWISVQYPPYSGAGKIDPFVSFIKIREYEAMEAAKKAKLQKKATTPLETIDVHSLKLIGILNKGEGISLAMVELPDGKSYLIRPGMTIGLYDGVVTSIGNEVLQVEEDIIDVFGEAKKRTITLRLRQEKE
jgi:type IV pilus assembly protein PilP